MTRRPLPAFAALWSLGLMLAGAVGCGGPLLVQNDITITMVPARGKAPFDPHAARLRQATEALFAVMGHAVELRFDEALVPAFEKELADAVADSVESLATALTAMKKFEPEIFAREVPRLTRIESHYSATLEGDQHNQSRFRAGVVSITEPSWRGLVEGRDVVGALEDDFLEARETRFAGKEPDDVAPADRTEYFGYAVETRSSDAARARRRAGGDREPMRRATEILRLTRLATLVAISDPGLAARIRAALCGDSALYIAAEDAFVAGTPEAAPGSLELRARGAWVAWVNAVLPSLSAEQRLRIANRIYARTAPLPGFDDFAFGLRVVDDWNAAGRPTRGADDDARFQLMDLVVCPATYDTRGDLDRRHSCPGGWVKHALLSDDGTRRLAEALGTRGDTQLVDDVIQQLQWTDAGSLTRLWRSLEPHPLMFQWATRGILERLGTHPGLSEHQANDLWRDHREYRGVALYILASDNKEQRYYADRFFLRFARLYGQGIDEDVFGRFLDLGPGAFSLVPTMWKGLTRGWSRSAAMGAHLDRALDDPLPPSESYGTMEAALEEITKRLCADKDAAEVARFHAILVHRAQKYPANARQLENVIADSDAARCAASASATSRPTAARLREGSGRSAKREGP